MDNFVIVKIMSKRPKKRNKPYKGEDAKITAPKVTRVKAVVRSPLGEWWHTRKKTVKLTSMIGGGAIIVIWLIYEGLRAIFRW